MEIIILAGGQAKRLRPITDDMPKCMVPINGKPMLDYHLQWLRKYDISKIILSCGYKWEKIKEHYGNALVYSVENEPLGTGGGIKLAMEHVEGDRFFVINCDDINNTDLDKLEKMGPNTVVISRFHSQFGIVETKNGLIKNFRQKPLLPYWANIGLYLLDSKIKLPNSGAIETKTFPLLAKRGQLKAFRHNGYWVTINTPKELEEAGDMLKKLKM